MNESINTRKKGLLTIFTQLLTPKNIILIVILLLSFLLRLHYFGYTHFYNRGHDVGGHIDFIKYVAAENRLPDKDACWQCYHPPFYFLIATGVYEAQLAAGSSIESALRGLQVLSILFFMGFLLFSSLIIRRYIKNLPAFVVAVAILCFWPSGIIHSARIGNDTLMYCLFAGAFYFLIRWFKEGDSKSLFIFCGFSLLTVFTKTNGIILMGIFGVLAVVNWIRERKKMLYFARMFPSLSILGFGLILVYADYLTRFFSGEKVDILAGNSADLPPQLFVPNTPLHYLLFNFKIFLTQPFTDPWQDGFGRQYFWNYLFKTSLFGEFRFEGLLHTTLAGVISILFLVLLLYTGVGIFTLGKRRHLSHLPVTLNLGFLLAAIMLFCIKITASCSNDFRYVVPVILSWALFFARGCLFFKRKGLPALTYAGYALGGIFVLLSALFFCFRVTI